MVLLFFALWLIFNGRVTVEIVVLGILLSCAVYLFGVKFMDFSPKKELRYLRLMPNASAMAGPAISISVSPKPAILLRTKPPTAYIGQEDISLSLRKLSGISNTIVRLYHHLHEFAIYF